MITWVGAVTSGTGSDEWSSDAYECDEKHAKQQTKIYLT